MTRRDVLPVPTESTEQQWLMRWAKMEMGAHPELRLLYHVPNEGKRGRIGGARAVAEGLRSGVPDLCLPVARGGYHGLYIELKRQEGGRLTPAQTQWINDLQEQGYRAVMCKGFGEASEKILAYLRGE